MGKMILGRFPPSFPHKRRGRKRLEPIEAGQLWVRVDNKECWRVERVAPDKVQAQSRCSRVPVYIYKHRRVYIQHVGRKGNLINAGWLKKDYSEQYFRRCFMEKKLHKKFYAEGQEILRRKSGKENITP